MTAAAVSRSVATLSARCLRIRLAVFDVDGVLTDGRLQLRARGAAGTGESKSFHVLDGHGLKQLGRAGIEVAWISGRDSAVVRARARELGVAHLHQGVSDKLPVLRSILARSGKADAPGMDQVLCMGDDLADLPLLQACGVALTVAHAPASLKLAADRVMRAAGGLGAVREACDWVLHLRARHDLL